MVWLSLDHLEQPIHKVQALQTQNYAQEAEGTNQTSPPSNYGVNLRERRPAFASMQSLGPQDNASKRTSLAAQRDLVRAAARAKENANRERYTELPQCRTHHCLFLLHFSRS